MLKRDKNFRISKQVKRTMATIVDPVERHAYKNSMIEAELFGSQVFEKKKKRNNETETT
jgi:hypothetical protein